MLYPFLKLGATKPKPNPKKCAFSLRIDAQPRVFHTPRRAKPRLASPRILPRPLQKEILWASGGWISGVGRSLSLGAGIHRRRETWDTAQVGAAEKNEPPPPVEEKTKGLFLQASLKTSNQGVSMTLWGHEPFVL